MGVIDLVRRAIFKLVVGRLRYGRGSGYDAARFWEDRLSRYGFALRGVGHEGLTESQNDRMYAEAAATVSSLLDETDLSGCRVLDVGCGNGFYAGLMAEAGVESYVGLDITDVLFPTLRTRFPAFKFIRRDISVDEIEGEFDLILVIDVLEHIVEEERLGTAMNSLMSCLSECGTIIVALPLGSSEEAKSKRSFFYLRNWTKREIIRSFRGWSYEIGPERPFRDGHIFAIRSCHSGSKP